MAALGCLSTLAVLQFFLSPGVHWYFRLKMNRVIDEVNKRFNTERPDFKRMRRQLLIDRLFHNDKVQAAVS